MLNTALYCILRVLPLVEAATGQQGWGRQILMVFGIASILMAAAFMVFQRDGKRLLAYSSVEHLGVMALGVGLGGVGTVAALWHALNHAIAKPLAFFAVGRLGQLYGTHDLGALTGALRRSTVWGIGFCGGLLALIGVAPFAIFMSEFQVLRAAAEAKAFAAVALFPAGLSIVFVGVLRHVMSTAWGEALVTPPSEPVGAADVALVGGALLALLALGLWLPAPLADGLAAAARVIGGRP
jgi:hydrogenase-4 component F